MDANGILAPKGYAPGQGVDDVTWKRVEQAATDAARELGLDGDAAAAASTVTSEALAVGPVTGLLEEDDVERVAVNGPTSIWVTRGGATSQAPGRFSCAAAVLTAARRLLATGGAADDGAFGSGYLHDGTRVHLATAAVGGPCLTIDRPVAGASLETLVSEDAMTANMASFVTAAMTHGRAVLVASNDTDTRFRFIQALIGAAENSRVVAVEGGGRLHGNGNTVVLCSGEGADNTALVQQALKMRPDRLVVGDARGPETFYALSALGGGVSGGVIGVDAESPDDAMARLVRQAALAVQVPDDRIDALVRETADVLIQVLRYADGRVVVTQVLDIDGEMNEVFNGLGGFRATGHVPRWVSNAQSLGHQIDLSIFQ